MGIPAKNQWWRERYARSKCWWDIKQSTYAALTEAFEFEAGGRPLLASVDILSIT